VAHLPKTAEEESHVRVSRRCGEEVEILATSGPEEKYSFSVRKRDGKHPT